MADEEHETGQHGNLTSLREPLRGERPSTRMRAHFFFHPDTRGFHKQCKRFQQAALFFRDSVMAVVLINIVLFAIDMIPIQWNDDAKDLLEDVNFDIVIPISLFLFTIEYLGRIWSIPEVDPRANPWKVRLCWAITILPLLELFAVLMMWVSALQMGSGSGSPQTANTAAVARGARVVRVVSKMSKVSKVVKGSKAIKAVKAAKFTKFAKAAKAGIAGGTAQVTVGQARKSKTGLLRSQSQQFLMHFRDRMSDSMKRLLEEVDEAEGIHPEEDCEDEEEGEVVAEADEAEQTEAQKPEHVSAAGVNVVAQP